MLYLVDHLGWETEIHQLKCANFSEHSHNLKPLRVANGQFGVFVFLFGFLLLLPLLFLFLFPPISPPPPLLLLLIPSSPPPPHLSSSPSPPSPPPQLFSLPPPPLFFFLTNRNSFQKRPLKFYLNTCIVRISLVFLRRLSTFLCLNLPSA